MFVGVNTTSPYEYKIYGIFFSFFPTFSFLFPMAPPTPPVSEATHTQKLNVNIDCVNIKLTQATHNN